MSAVNHLIKRNLKLYLRDRSSIFFSLLSMLIVIMLMLVFLGDMNVNDVLNILEQAGVTGVSRDSAQQMVLLWTIVGVLCVNTVTIALTVTGQMVRDAATGRAQSFYGAPVSRLQIAVGYIGASFLGTMGICLLTLGVSDGYLLVTGHSVLSLTEHLAVIGMLAANAFSYSAVMFLVGLFVKSEGAWSGLGTVVGTLVGFLGAIYIPMGGLPSAVQNFLKATPILHSASMLRRVFTATALQDMFAAAPAEAVSEYKTAMGITVTMGGQTVSLAGQIAAVLICGILVLAAAALVMRRKSVQDR